jgi:hypothetical protein
MTNTDQIELGDEVKDIVSGFTGIATARTEFLNGCVRISIDPPVDKDGKPVDGKWFDVEQVEVMQRAKVQPRPATPKATTTGGDRPDHPPR